MRLTKWFSRSLAKWTLALGCVTISNFAMESQALAHHPFRHHGCFGGHGWGGHYYGGYSSFYGVSSSFYYPSFSFGYTPRYYSVNYFAPSYFAPAYYPPVYYPPVYYAPAYAPCTLWSGVQLDAGLPIASTSLPRSSASAALLASNQVNSPLAMRTSSSQAKSLLAGMQVAMKDTRGPVVKASDVTVKEPGIKLVSNKPALLQPYSPIWTKAAAGIVDDMVAAGELDHAHSSCKSMERITQPKGAGVYLRQALLNYFSNGSSAQKSSTEEILQLLELACEAGSQVQPSELAKDSLRDYFAACQVDVNGTMEQLSKSVLESPNNSGRELLLLSALLKLDGQTDRAKLFATEVEGQVSKTGSFRWNSLLEACLN